MTLTLVCSSCKAQSKFYHPLPNTSIIIVFHNEGNSTLLRTLVSIINRTPWKLIHEIILLDDASVDRGETKISLSSMNEYRLEYLHEPLERFIQTLPVKTLLLRNERRLGLISSRVKGSFLSRLSLRSDLLSFFSGEDRHGTDNHVSRFSRRSSERLVVVSSGRNQKGSVSSSASLSRSSTKNVLDRKTIVCPIIDVLTYDAFQLLHGATDIFGTFSWKMIFRWTKIQGSNSENQAAPVR